MAHSDIDHVNGFTIRKLHSPDKTKVFGYLTGVADANGDMSGVKRFETLEEAREECGFENKLPAFVTAPKSDNPQNRKGYRADSGKSAKK